MSIQIEGKNTIMNASNEWSKRPADERFNSLEALHEDAMNDRKRSAQATIADMEMKARAVAGEVLLVGNVSEAKLNNWSFGQLAIRADAPASYLRTLPSELAADCINNGLKHSDGLSRLLIKRQDPPHSGLPTIGAINSDRYGRIWDADITARLLDLKNSGRGWQEAPAAFDGSRGMYRGDRDMFAFMVDNDRRIFETGPAGGLSRGFFARNSQVGAAKFCVTTFYYEYVCGNHRIWGAQDIAEISVRHVGEGAAARAFHGLQVKLVEYANKSTADDELRVKSARDYVLGANKDDVLDTVLGIKNIGLSQKLVTSAYELATRETDNYGSPNTVWGFNGGLTQLARDLPNADERLLVDRAAGKIMELAF